MSRKGDAPAAEHGEASCDRPDFDRRNELAPLHAITSSAVTRSVHGIARSSALAVLRGTGRPSMMETILISKLLPSTQPDLPVLQPTKFEMVTWPFVSILLSQPATKENPQAIWALGGFCLELRLLRARWGRRR
jgi:hypothetical protein